MTTAEKIKKEYETIYNSGEMVGSTLVEIHNAACQKVMSEAADQTTLNEAFASKM